MGRSALVLNSTGKVKNRSPWRHLVPGSSASPGRRPDLPARHVLFRPHETER